MAVVSKHLVHPNIVPLLGIAVDPYELISDWMPGGDLMGYIDTHPDADRRSLVRFPSSSPVQLVNPLVSYPTLLKVSAASILTT